MKPNVLIGTPAYGGMVHVDYLHSMIGIQTAKNAGLLDFSIMTIGNESLITRGRNTIISAFYNNPQFTHLFFVDGDLKFPKELLPTLLYRNVDIIGSPVPLKGFDANGNPVYNVGKILNHCDEYFYEVEHVGTAILLLSRNCVTDLCKNSKIYKASDLTRGNAKNDLQYDVFQVGVENGNYLSEDFYVCHKLRELGYKIYIDDSFSIIHNGNYSFGFNRSNI